VVERQRVLKRANKKCKPRGRRKAVTSTKRRVLVSLWEAVFRKGARGDGVKLIESKESPLRGKNAMGNEFFRF